MRRLVAIFLLFFISCQTFATAAQGMTFGHADAEEQAHTLLHWEGAAHHHDDHGAYHQDDSEESVQHILADAGLNATALLQAAFPLFAAERMPSPAEAPEAAGPPPYLGGLIRPPRLTA
ncbi:hypothetical protein [Pigmentiphaga sp.]|uniref:hypothetical protein n=1 Tax=Pigmentiphaga sp. TaxID=1977564 RepID=UPI0025FFFEAE|nr:hypothetical protein [Pigmentiphaga sp.]